MYPRLRSLLPAGALCLAAVPLAGQNAPHPPSAAAVRRAVETITEADMRSRIAIIADDSMRGRDTPSPGLDATAEWIAAQFQRLGLQPGGDSGSFLQRYRIRRSQMDSSSFVLAMGRGATSRLRIGREFGWLEGEPPESVVTAPLVLMAGVPADTAMPFGSVPVRGAVVVVAVPGGQFASLLSSLERVVTRGIREGVRGWLLLVGSPTPRLYGQLARFASEVRSEVLGVEPAQRPTAQPSVLFARDSAMLEVLRAAGEDPATLFAPEGAGIRALPGFTITISARRNVLSDATAPNVVGILEGSDPQLRSEAVVFSAHMDHSGVGRPVNGDSIYNGADDDASGTVGVVELVEAFASLTPRPRRSMVFLTVSGEERGLWGSNFYAQHPAIPLDRTVADLNMDMIGRYHRDQPGWRDTISVIGKEHSTLGAVANRVTEQHPELHMRLVDDMWPGENFYFRSDHIHFARRGVPILFFFNGTHPDYHRVTDSVDRIDAEKAARIVRMVFYIGLEVANTTARPEWNPESRRQIVQGQN